MTLVIAIAMFVAVSYRIGRRPLYCEKQIVVAAAPSRVFAALTEPEQLVCWIGGLESSTALTEGGLRLGARSRDVIVVTDSAPLWSCCDCTRHGALELR